MLLRTRTKLKIPGLITRVFQSKGGLWFPEFDFFARKHNNVLAILRKQCGEALIIPASNIVTDTGDVWYAESACGETPTNAFNYHEMQSAGTPAKGADRSAFTAIASTSKVETTLYPKSNDDDTDNTGAATDVVTHQASYATSDFNHAAITHGIISNTAMGASEPILTGYAFSASFEKTATDTLKVIVNHTMNGV